MLYKLNYTEQNSLLDILVKHMKVEAASRSRADGHWRSMSAELQPLGLEKPKMDIIAWWANTQSRNMKNRPWKLRILHSMEREIISVESYGYLLELSQIGLLTPLQFEQVMEESAMMTSLPVQQDQIKGVVIKILTQVFSKFEMQSSH